MYLFFLWEVIFCTTSCCTFTVCHLKLFSAGKFAFRSKVSFSQSIILEKHFPFEDHSLFLQQAIFIKQILYMNVFLDYRKRYDDDILVNNLI